MREDIENMDGNFTVTGGKLVVTDPCYDRGTWCQGVLENVLDGVWKSTMVLSDEGTWGVRVKELAAYHASAGRVTALEETHERASFEVGVDSGQAGIFDESRYPQGKTGEYGDDDTFYGRACEATLGEKNSRHGGIIAEGVVSSSGYGDGGYECFFHKNSIGKIDAVRICFISDAEEPEDDGSGDSEEE